MKAGESCVEIKLCCYCEENSITLRLPPGGPQAVQCGAASALGGNAAASALAKAKMQLSKSAAKYLFWRNSLKAGPALKCEENLNAAPLKANGY